MLAQCKKVCCFSMSHAYIATLFQDAKIAAAFISGFFASFLSLPFDLAKTRIQKQRPDANGVLPYRNLPHCMMKVCDLTTYLFDLYTPMYSTILHACFKISRFCPLRVFFHSGVDSRHLPPALLHTL